MYWMDTFAFHTRVKKVTATHQSIACSNWASTNITHTLPLIKVGLIICWLDTYETDNTEYRRPFNFQRQEIQLLCWTSESKWKNNNFVWPDKKDDIMTPDQIIYIFNQVVQQILLSIIKTELHSYFYNITWLYKTQDNNLGIWRRTYYQPG